MAHLDSVNIGRARPNRYESASSTGIDKQPQNGPVWVRDPGPKTTGWGSGLVGDFVGDTKHHGGRDQAVYASAARIWTTGRIGSTVSYRTAFSVRT